MNVEIDRGVFGAVLRRLRLQTRISQEELAERCHLSVESISALERGRRRAPYRETIRLLGDGLALSDAQRRELEAAAARRTRTAMMSVVTAHPRTGPVAPEIEPNDGPARQNLPLQRTNLVGREADIETIVRVLSDSRLITLTGAGGVGKTRTALAVGNAALEQFAGGVWLVELAPVGADISVAAAVSRALNIHEMGARPPLEPLLGYLKHKTLLLILDNCEHVIGEAAALADALLRGCPRLRILVTSREPLRLGGESTYRLPSLRFPTAREARRLDADGARDFAAVALFVQRAQRSNRVFVLDETNAPVVAEICCRLDGIPLAIELAAARVHVMSLQSLAANLNHRLRLLTGGDRTALPRQQTMRALIDWSYDLLTPPERRLFEYLSMFAGGCTVEALSEVSCEGITDETQVLDLLSSLIDKSLVVAELDVPEPRYRLLETSREYASEKLAVRGETALIAHRHARAYVALAERMECEHDVERNSVWFARAELELENWRTALYWTLVERGDVVLGQRLVCAMRAVWPASAMAERRRWLDAARAHVDEGTPPIVAANLRHSVNTVAYMFGEFASALADSERLVDVYAALGDALGVARAQFLVGRCMTLVGRLAEGEAVLQQSLAAARALGNMPLAGLALAGIARARSAANDFPSARAYLAEAFAVYDSTGADAYAVLSQSAAASIEFSAGDAERAIEFSRAALVAMRTFGLTLFLTTEANCLAGYLIACDRWDAARTHAHEALELAQETHQTVEGLWAVSHLAAVEALAAPSVARAQTAAQLTGYADARIAVLGTTRQYMLAQEYDRLVRALCDTLGEDVRVRLTQSGAALTDDQAIALAQSV